ncbi:MAG: hypothetical protein EZS28_050916, partial [Streblomastix strix]
MIPSLFIDKKQRYKNKNNRNETGQQRLQRIYPTSLIEEDFVGRSANSGQWCISLQAQKLQISKQSKIIDLFDDPKDLKINSQVQQGRQLARQFRQEQQAQRDRTDETADAEAQVQLQQDIQREQKRYEEQELWRTRDPFLRQLLGQYNAQGNGMAYVDIGGHFMSIHEAIDIDMVQRVESERRHQEWMNRNIRDMEYLSDESNREREIQEDDQLQERISLLLPDNARDRGRAPQMIQSRISVPDVEQDNEEQNQQEGNEQEAERSEWNVAIHHHIDPFNGETAACSFCGQQILLIELNDHEAHCPLNRAQQHAQSHTEPRI